MRDASRFWTKLMISEILWRRKARVYLFVLPKQEQIGSFKVQSRKHSQAGQPAVHLPDFIVTLTAGKL